jgi:hypothetical protein
MLLAVNRALLAAVIASSVGTSVPVVAFEINVIDIANRKTKKANVLFKYIIRPPFLIVFDGFA